MTVDEKIVMATVVLKHAVPSPIWQAFLDTLAGRQQAALERCVSTGPDNIFQAQGAARELRDLLVLLRDADKTADKISRRT